jgi:hypothetical protein
MQLSTGYFRSDFVKICDFYIGNAAQFSIRSDPFLEVFLKDLSSKVAMYAYWSITYAYTLYHCFSVDFCAKISNFEPKCGPILIRSIPFNSELDPFLCVVV